MLNYIPDGYTATGYIEASEGKHDALAFAFRPMLPEERDAVEEVLAIRPAREVSQVVAGAGGRPKKLIRGVELLLFHAGPAAVACGECQKYVFQVDTAGQVTPRRLQHAGEDWLRPAGVPPPCGKCPKRSPQEAVLYELS